MGNSSRPRAIVTAPDLDDAAQMRAFWQGGAPPVVANAQRVGFQWQGDGWACAVAVPSR